MAPEAGPEAMELIRSMIDQVVLTPSPSGHGVKARLHRALAGVLAACGGQTHEHPGSCGPGCQVSVREGSSASASRANDQMIPPPPPRATGRLAPTIAR